MLQFCDFNSTAYFSFFLAVVSAGAAAFLNTSNAFAITALLRWLLCDQILMLFNKRHFLRLLVYKFLDYLNYPYNSL